MIKVEPTPIPGVLVVRPRVFRDERGSFRETWRADTYAAAGLPDFVQDNVSVSHKGVLRGLHAQRAPYEQGKLVGVLQGRVYDVAVDIRPESPTFKRWYAIELDSESGVQLYIPPGCLHGFLALEDETVVQYKCTAAYDASAEFSVRWDDPGLAVQWPCQPTMLSAKDAGAAWWADVARGWAKEGLSGDGKTA